MSYTLGMRKVSAICETCGKHSKVPNLKQMCDPKLFPTLKDLLNIPTRGGSYAFAVDEEGNIWFIEQTYPDETRYLKMEASER